MSKITDNPTLSDIVNAIKSLSHNDKEKLLSFAIRLNVYNQCKSV